MITLERVKTLRRGDILHSEIGSNADGTCQRWRVFGEVKTWKTDPNRVRVPIKHGYHDHDYLTGANLNIVHLASECPMEVLKDRFFRAMENTWQAIAPDAFQSAGIKSMSRRTVIEIVLDADRLLIFGNDKEAAAAFYKLPLKQQMSLAKEHFIERTYTN